MPQRAFDETVLPHLDAAFNYARWLTGSHVEAEDVVQDACVRAMRFFSSLRGEDARAWLLAIVRNSWYSQLARRPRPAAAAALEEPAVDPADESLDPEALLIRQGDVGRVQVALAQLPADFREVMVLREIEGLSYKEIAEVVQIPIGTVMSRLSRARERLLVILKPPAVTPGRMP